MGLSQRERGGAASSVELTPTSFDVDLESLPVLRVRFPPAPPVDDIDLHIENLLRIHRALGPFALLANIDAVQPLEVSAMHRTRFAAGSDKLARAGVLLAEAIVASSPIMRGMYIAYTWLRKDPSHPTECFPTDAEAQRWLQGLQSRSWPSSVVVGQ